MDRQIRSYGGEKDETDQIISTSLQPQKVKLFPDEYHPSVKTKIVAETKSEYLQEQLDEIKKTTDFLDSER